MAAARFLSSCMWSATACLLMPALAHATEELPAERAVEAPGPLGPLRGLLLRATQARAPLAIVVPGSGPTDRDGNSPTGMKSSTYRLLAEGLAAQGITTARVDKRGMFSSAGAVADPNAVTLQDYASDVRTWAQELRRDTGARCAWVIGHSEGGLVALLAGAEDPAICGAILLATPGRPLASVLREQLQSSAGASLGPATTILDALAAGRRVDESRIPPALLPLFHPRVQPFLIAAMAVDPVREIAKYHKPVLILQGERDLQVRTDDALALSRAAPDAELVFVRDANHVFKRVASEDRLANLAAYADPSLPLADGVVRAIVAFLFRQPQR